jgi:hypothetical protein
VVTVTFNNFRSSANGPAMTAAILHLSDIHIRTAQDPILGKAQAIAASIYSSLPLASHVFTLISGDIAFSGKAEEYALASRFLSEIESAIRIEKTMPRITASSLGTRGRASASLSGSPRATPSGVGSPGGGRPESTIGRPPSNRACSARCSGVHQHCDHTARSAGQAHAPIESPC